MVSVRDVLWQLRCTNARGCLKYIAMSGLGNTVYKLAKLHHDAEVVLTAAAVCAYWTSLMPRRLVGAATVKMITPPRMETPEEGLRRGGGLPPKFLAECPTDALAHVLEWVSPRPPAPDGWVPWRAGRRMIRRRVQDIARLKLVCKPFRAAAGLLLKQGVEAAVVERAKREAE